MKRVQRVLLVGCTMLLVAGACGKSDDKPSVSIKSPASGGHVKGNVAVLDLVVKRLSIIKADGDTSGKTGHYHVFIDTTPVAPGAAIPKGPGIVHSADNPVRLFGLTTGRHTVQVALGDGAHTRIGSLSKRSTVVVDGPAVDASAPATLAAGQALTITVKVQGVQLVKADGDTSGRTGHLHVFVDRDPTPGGQPIPKVEDGSIIHTADTTIEVPNLAVGEHTIWVVLGDGAHTPFALPVMDKLTVTVT